MFFFKPFGSSSGALSGNEITVCDYTGYIRDMMGGARVVEGDTPPIISCIYIQPVWSHTVISFPDKASVEEPKCCFKNLLARDTGILSLP